MKFLKKVISMSLLIAVTLTPYQANAASIMKDKTISPTQTVVIENNDISVPTEIIEQLIKENPDAGNIHILYYGDLVVEPFSNSNNGFYQRNVDLLNAPTSPKSISPVGMYSQYENIKTTLTREAADFFAKDEFKFSVAKGEIVTLSRTYEGSLTGSFTGSPIEGNSIGVSFTIKATYQEGTTYSGPSETSGYNSREFRMKFYEDIGSYTQTADLVSYYYGTKISSKPTTFQGKYYKPTKYLSYSVDRKL